MTACVSKQFREAFLSSERIPIVSLDEYEFKTVFDWLEIYLPTKGRHQARNVHERLMKMNMEHPGFSSCRVWGPRRENGYVGDRFVVRMQDPQPATLYGLLRRILEHYCHEGTGPDEIPITGLELSLDIYPAKSKQFEEQAYAARRMQNQSHATQPASMTGAL